MQSYLWVFNEMPERDWLLVACVLIAITSLPLAMRWIPPNAFYGFRTKFTRSSPAVWYPANAFMGRAMFLASIASAALILYGPRLATWWTSLAVVLLPLAIATLAGFVYLRHLRETLQRR